MIDMMREADAESGIRATGIRQRSRDAAGARRRILRELHRQAAARRKGRRWATFKKFLLGVAAVVGAAAAIVASPFTGGGSLVAYLGAALGVTAAVAGAAGASAGIVQGSLESRAALAGARSGRASAGLGDAVSDLDRLSAEARDVVERAASISRRVIEIERREASLASTATRRTS